METRCSTLRCRATHHRRDLPFDGVLEADPLQLPVRSPVICGASGHRARRWWRFGQVSYAVTISQCGIQRSTNRKPPMTEPLTDARLQWARTFTGLDIP